MVTSYIHIRICIYIYIYSFTLYSKQSARWIINIQSNDIE